MQPDRNQNDWQQPAQQPPQSPYTAPASVPQQPTVAPVVTLTPDTPGDTPAQPQPASVSAQPESSAQVAPPAAESVPQEAPDASHVEEQPVRWQAHEYIHHEKSPAWFIIFTIVVVVLVAVAIFIIHSWTFTILIPVMAAALLTYTHRPPRVLDYTLSRQGIHVNDHLYPFTEFKGFGVIHDGDEYSVMLIPTKRFKPGTTIYFPEESGEAIVDMLGARLPMQELHLDLVDKIIRKLRI